MADPNRTTRVGDYLIERLAAHGVGHVFGVPGDFVLSFMSKMAAPGSPLTLVNTCDEQGAGSRRMRTRGCGGWGRCA